MSRFPLEIERYMSTVLIVIGPAQPLSEAIRLMRLHEVRHLPVVKRNKVVGVLSQRDIYRTQSLGSGALSEILVSEVTAADPYTVEPDEPIDRVARQMVRRKIGTALVTHNDRLLGMFTTTDALLALAALVDDERVPGEDDVIEPATPRPRARSKPATKSAKPAAKGARKERKVASRAKSRV
jgi:CBS domain-containing protein